ncbi:MAG: hypothetical protein HKN13_08690, partial [Rhodothermales bacterium]|nr:hypothetical protein [Rhodothermales bacterium]
FSTTGSILDEPRTFYPALRQILRDLQDYDLKTTITVPWAKFFARSLGHEPADTSLGDTLMQVALHTQHHRAQISTYLRELDVSPPMVDYIGWVWSGRPDPEWS